ncbi:LytR cell envelope-related transcriptional attenuator [Amycolatopsis pretoriensis]|uniref:LytR cell envelope-related transcriptional attenuator n=2 Tax=Amycolatopsis pretoriensis TaxID=218821 RepID=A0A1H5RE60_9PSEU|nr:LytR C-terminal domain-containing protein [Amycolatopsis pretoriensis]SEF36605.1 LytR cell envelope-related transcriptional attenuator [Amycolatopsis pretoriensis]
MSVFSGMSRPMKAAGVALVGVAIIAAVIGGISALSGGNGSNEAGPSGTATQPGTSGGTSAPPATSSTATPPSTSTPASPTPPVSTTPAPGQPTPGQPGQPGQPGDQQAGNKWVTVRVFNNSTIKGLADRAAEDFRGGGWTINEVSNYSQGVIPTTTAFYRPGTDEEAAAKQLAQEFGIKAEPRFPGIESASPGVIVIVTKEYQSGHKGS